MSKRDLTMNQIVALAPDAASAKAGQGLATARKWVTTGQDERAVWGECSGSGALPYQVAVDTTEAAFRCSCPSRKVPCKHVLGLLMLRTTDASAVPTATPPEWVSAWITSRDARAEQRAARPAPRPRTVDPEAASPSRERREERVAAGLQGLARWLEDLVRQGLAAAQSRPYAYWEGVAARLVDAQAPGAARLVRQMARIPSSGPGWPDRLLEVAARLHLVIEGNQRIGSLPAGVADDLRAAIGWTLRQEEIVTREGMRDRWAVLGRRVGGEERLRFQYLWLAGAGSGRVALLLAFAHGAQPFELNLTPGSWIEGDVVFYPGSAPLRGTLRDGHRTVPSSDRFPRIASIVDAVAAYAAALARNPWLELYPVVLRAVVPGRSGEGWTIRDGDGRGLPLHPAAADRAWVLLALSGGHPIDIVAEWDGTYAYPLSAVAGDRVFPLDTLVMDGAA